MFGVGGTSPKTPEGKVIWWLLFSVLALCVLYVFTK